MRPDLLAAIYAALKTHPAIQRELLELEAQGHLIATQEPLRPGDWGRACRYRLRGEG